MQSSASVSGLPVKRPVYANRLGSSRYNPRVAFSSEPPRPTDAVNKAFFSSRECQTKGLAASESEGSPSKNTASNFQEMKSFGDAICLSIAHVAQAQRNRGEVLPLGLISGSICRVGLKQELNLSCRVDVPFFRKFLFLCLQMWFLSINC